MTPTSGYRTRTYARTTTYARTYGPPPPPPAGTSQFEADRPDPEPTRASYGAYPYEYGNKGYVKRRKASEHDSRDLTAGRVQIEGGYAGDRVWRTGER